MILGRIYSSFILAATSLYIAIPTLRRGLDPLPTLHPLAGYYLPAIMVAGTVFSFLHAFRTWREVRNPMRTTPPSTMWISILFLGAITVAAWTRFHGLESDSVWYDEDRQMIATLVADLPGNELVYSAAFQQQPPLDYALSWQDLRWFHFSEWGMRFHSALLGTLSIPLLVGLVLRLGGGAVAAWISLLLGLLNGWLIHYSQEGRPVSLGIFLLLLHLHVVIDLFQVPRWRHASAATWALVLFLHSVGLQPVIVALCLAVGTLPLLAAPALRRPALMNLLATGVGLLVVIPTIGLIYQIANDSGQRHVNPVAALDLVNAVFRTPLTDFLLPVRLLLPFDRPFWPMVLCAMVLLLRRADAPDHRQGVFLTFFIAALLFPFFFFALFRTVVEPRVHERHYLTILPILVILFAMATDVLVRALSSLSLFRNVAVRIPILLLGGLCVTVYAKGPSRDDHPVLIRDDWKGVYAMLETEAKPGDVALVFSLGSPGAWTPQGFVSTHFYYYWQPVEHRVRLMSEWNRESRTQADIAYELLAPSTTATPPATVFLVVPDRWTSPSVPLGAITRSAGLRFGQTEGLSWLAIPTGGNPCLALEEALGPMDALVPDSPESYRLWELRAVCAFHRGRFDDASRFVDLMERHDPRHALTERLTLWRERVALAEPGQPWRPDDSPPMAPHQDGSGEIHP